MDVGQVHTEHAELTPKLVNEFAKLSGDFNPLHLDAEYARTTPYGRPVVPGLLVGALLSGILGTRFPGYGAVLIEETLMFHKPLFVGDTVLLRISVEHVRPDKPIVTLYCEVLSAANELAADGRFTVKVNR